MLCGWVCRLLIWVCVVCIVVGLQVAFGVCDLVITMVSWCVVVWAVLILFYSLVA